jgi:2-polyprenyl-3-methyl-5-hydroxy-6-metoxy-1,4-benzoquinol methylase
MRLLRNKQPALVNKLFEVVPDHLKGHEILVQLKHQYTPPKIWEQDTVEIYCGQAWEDWAAPSVINGIGGSEEAVIYLSKELAKLGWKVTVYCSCGDMAGEYEGVTYKQYYEFNFNDHHNVVISWRNNIFRKGMTVKKRYVWLHDVMPQGTFNSGNIEYFDKAIVLSEYHKNVIGLLPNKTYVSRNGINQQDFRGSKEVRNPHRLIYTSSYDRGIEHLLKRWSEVRRAVPDAELHLFYGWDTYDKMMEVGRRPKDYREYMTKLMQQEGVFEHGRVGHKRLIKEFYKSGVYVYPTHFDEISCISAMKAQECGCVPVVFDFAALKETVQSGVKLAGNALTEGNMDKYISELINILQDVDEQELLRSDIPKGIWGWDKVAKDWSDELLTLRRRTYKDYEDYKSYYVTHGDFRTSNFSDDGQFLIYPRYQVVLDYVKKQGYKRFLDAGCSDGVLCYAVSKMGCHAHGIDADKKTIEFAQKYTQEFNLDCEFMHGLLEEFCSKALFDCASAFEILEHVIDPKEFLNILESNVVDGGLIFLSTPEKDGFYGERNFNEQHINHFTKESLEALIGKERIVEWRSDKDTLLVVYKK